MTRMSHLPLTTVLTRSYAVNVRDVSTTGCLLETHKPMLTGTVGLLTLEFGGKRRIEAFRICRTHRLEGAGTVYLAGAEFLLTMPPGQDSLRVAVAQLEALEGVENGSRQGTIPGAAMTIPLAAPSGAAVPRTDAH